MSEHEDDLRPSEGARFLLERRDVALDDGHASYAAAIFTPAERRDYTVVLDMSGGAALTEGAGTGDGELEDTLVTIARLVARSAAKKRAEGLPPWPPRVLRWRGPGRGS